MGKFVTFLRISGVERRLFLEAVFWCAMARLAIVFIPFRKYYWLLGHSQPLDHEPPLPEESPTPCLTLIAKAVRRASKHVPWKTRCLVEAIAAKRMLARRHIPCTAYLGVAKDKGHLIAHAWLKSHGIFITGALPGQNYTVVHCFQ